MEKRMITEVQRKIAAAPKSAVKVFTSIAYCTENQTYPVQEKRNIMNGIANCFDVEFVAFY